MKRFLIGCTVLAIALLTFAITTSKPAPRPCPHCGGTKIFTVARPSETMHQCQACGKNFYSPVQIGFSWAQAAEYWLSPEAELMPTNVTQPAL